jgi:hypothetical protein
MMLCIGCSDSVNKESDNTIDTAAAVESVTERLKADVPDKDYEGYNFTFVTIGPGMNVHWALPEIYVEELNGDIINDCIYQRNSRISEQFNIKITANFSQSPVDTAKKSILANSDDFDVISTGIQFGVQSLVLEGYLLDLKEVPYIDLNKPWWDKNAREQLSVANKLYVTISDLGYRDKEATWIFTFNKTMIKDFNLEDPYQLVRDRQWTFEKMYEMAGKVSSDINGDSVMDQNDRYGLAAQNHTALAFAESGEILIAAKNADDLPELVFMNAKTEAILTKVLELFKDSNNVFLAQKFKGFDDIWDAQLQMMNDNRALFQQTLMNRVLLMRKYECDFGILPQPLMYEGQTEYCAPVDLACTSSVSIPITSGDPERTGIILEALTADSYYGLIPSYYEVAIKSKGLRDVESLEMFDIIFGNRIYDIGWAYGFGGIADMVTAMGQTGQTNVASQYEKRESQALKDLEKFIGNIQSIKK